MALYNREVEVFLSACTGTNLLSFMSLVCVSGPASVREGVTGSWQGTFCHMASASGKQDELKPVMKIKQDKLFFKMFGFRQPFFFFTTFSKLSLYWYHRSSCRNAAFNVTVLPVMLISDTLVCVIFFFSSHTIFSFL